MTSVSARRLAAIASTYEEPEQVVEVYHEQPPTDEWLRNRVLEEQVAEWMAEKAKCSDKPMSFSDVMKPPAQG